MVTEYIVSSSFVEREGFHEVMPFLLVKLFCDLLTAGGKSGINFDSATLTSIIV